MVTKYFKIDQIVLKDLCKKQVERTPKGKSIIKSTQRSDMLPDDDGMDQGESSRSIWEQVFNFQSIGIQYV